jgi:hypothetical protein
MIDVKKELRTGGVAGLFRAMNLNELAVEEFAEGHGADLRAAWQAMGNPGLMACVAIECGVPHHDVVQALYQVQREALTELGCEPHRVTRKVLEAVDYSLQHLDGVSFSALQMVVLEASKWLVQAKDKGELAEPWESLTVMSACGLAQATLVVACTCGGADHVPQLYGIFEQWCFSVNYARILHAEQVGRIPKGGSDTAKAEWSAGHTSNMLRKQLPVELLTAPRMIEIPTVTPEGKIRRVKRERGQA